MWLFCKSGFFSAVEHWGNPGVIHLRARFRGDLERLRAVHGLEMVTRIVESPGCDYPFRMDLGKELWQMVLAKEAKDIDYTNFKDAVHDGTVRDEAYLAVWAALRRAQRGGR